MLLNLFLLIAGFGLLIKGADWLVEGSSSLARKHGISDLAIGLTIVAFGTSTPELVVNLFAAGSGHHAIVFGNIIGSNNFNLLAILGIAGCLAPLAVQKGTVRIEIPISFGATVALFLLANDHFQPGNGLLSRLDAVILLAGFAGFLYYVTHHIPPTAQGDVPGQVSWSGLRIWTMIILGLGLLVAGGKLVVDRATALAIALGVSEKVIALTIVAAGTSLPELATSVVAALKKNTDIAIGNVIGSNIFNILFILPLSALIMPVTFDTVFNIDLLLLGFSTLLLFLAMFLGHPKRLDRWESVVLLCIYAGYTFFLIQKEM